MMKNWVVQANVILVKRSMTENFVSDNLALHTIFVKVVTAA